MKTLRDPNRQPTHPGAVLREDVLPAIDMTQTEFAERLRVSRLTISELLHEKRALIPTWRCVSHGFWGPRLKAGRECRPRSIFGKSARTGAGWPE